MAITGFLPADDPRMRSTIDAIASHLAAPNGLLYRYLGDDGLDGDEAPFLICWFWLAECWALAGELDLARAVFERAAAHANDVGLLSEEADDARPARQLPPVLQPHRARQRRRRDRPCRTRATQPATATVASGDRSDGPTW